MGRGRIFMGGLWFWGRRRREEGWEGSSGLWDEDFVHEYTEYDVYVCR